ncbi:barstar family protein [Robertkochia solimangrovi]|uniref:barstar family protein n=1 Tax=Robertkochia solimangrovi TaxID=2213046 RepID=UPI00117F5F90|nr:ribonuclease inhibitor [Robertkochia solimangrovi]TRZ42236.1 ribonuclease inhibitor [Robertkochia solimangrovi]
MSKTIIIEGKNFNDIPSFYEEINRVFMQEVDWKLGQSLDALNDMFYGGFGLIEGKEPIKLIWKNFKQSEQDFGKELTRDYYLEKLKQPEKFNKEVFQKRLEALERGEGKTYFEIILEIIEGHPNIELVPE